MEISKIEFLKACNDKEKQEESKLAELERLAREKAERERLAREKAERERLAREKWRNTIKNSREFSENCKNEFVFGNYKYRVDYDNMRFTKDLAIREMGNSMFASGGNLSLNEELGISSPESGNSNAIGSNFRDFRTISTLSTISESEFKKACTNFNSSKGNGGNRGGGILLLDDIGYVDRDERRLGLDNDRLQYINKNY